MVHIVFQPADAEALARAFALDAGLEADILVFRDDLATGPIGGLDTEEGRQDRHAWWVRIGAPGAQDHVAEDHARAEQLRARLASDAAETAWIWVAPNAHDVAGYYWLIGRLRDFPGQVHLLFLSNLPFLSDKGHVFYPHYLFEISAREFVKAQKLVRPLATSEFEVDPDEWLRLSAAAADVRYLEGGKKLGSSGAAYFDAGLKKQLTAEWQKATRVVHQFLAKAPQKTGDLFLLWRLKEMAKAGEAEEQGEMVRQISL